MRARNFQDVKSALRKCEEFTHATMSGKWYDSYAPNSARNGLMREIDALIAENQRGVYVVKSYDTIIAYAQFDVDGNMIVRHIEPNVYSATTSRHTGYVRSCLPEFRA